MTKKHKTKREREPERVQKGPDFARKLFSLIGIKPERSKNNKKDN